eukprot:g11050.t1
MKEMRKKLSKIERPVRDAVERKRKLLEAIPNVELVHYAQGLNWMHESWGVQVCHAFIPRVFSDQSHFVQRDFYDTYIFPKLRNRMETFAQGFGIFPEDGVTSGPTIAHLAASENWKQDYVRDLFWTGGPAAGVAARKLAGSDLFCSEVRRKNVTKAEFLQWRYGNRGQERIDDGGDHGHTVSARSAELETLFNRILSYQLPLEEASIGRGLNNYEDMMYTVGGWTVPRNKVELRTGRGGASGTRNSNSVNPVATASSSIGSMTAELKAFHVEACWQDYSILQPFELSELTRSDAGAKKRWKQRNTFIEMEAEVEQEDRDGSADERGSTSKNKRLVKTSLIADYYDKRQSDGFLLHETEHDVTHPKYPFGTKNIDDFWAKWSCLFCDQVEQARKTSYITVV